VHVSTGSVLGNELLVEAGASKCAPAEMVAAVAVTRGAGHGPAVTVGPPGAGRSGLFGGLPPSASRVDSTRRSPENLKPSREPQAGELSQGQQATGTQGTT
jgi:hypothetical protein